ncbi:MAG: 16S rRNA (cytidine(1402)-2'-O)-methyltransferase [Negativicutes bacterium]|nr:16S rRNA (cytidine(1402)-2'-O)-methyltransferase [Negativicutes bacterium]
MINPGTLYLCPTPIGNLEDMTFRAVRTLREVAVIAAEDTRHTRKLLNHFDIHTPLISYHEHNKAERGPELIARLENGESVAVVSDAGMPGISDPGSDLVRLAIAAKIPVVPLPGANAALTALVCSGLDTTMFTFAGFLPKTAKKRREVLAQLAGHPYTLIFYEAPHRIVATLAEIEQAFGDRDAVAGRELTKVFEEFIRGKLSAIRTHFATNQPRGEFTLIIAGCSATSEDHSEEASWAGSPVEAVAALVAAGMSKKEAIKKVASDRGLSKRDVYQAAVNLK